MKKKERIGVTIKEYLEFNYPGRVEEIYSRDYSLDWPGRIRVIKNKIKYWKGRWSAKIKKVWYN